jgi:parallel beta-helix repeat protein
VIDIASDEISPRLGNGIWVGNVNNLVISGNRIDRVSYNGIYADANSTTISNNVVSNCILLLNDGGGIYTAGNRTDFRIMNNIVSNMVGNLDGTPLSSSEVSGVGIYLDEISSGYIVAGNIVYDCVLGMQLHRAYNNVVVNNSLYNNTIGIWLQERYPEEMHDNNFYNNILLCTKSNQLTWHESTHPDSNIGMGQYDYNLHYNPCRRYVINCERAGNNQLFTLGSWCAFSGQDRHSIAQDPLFLDAENYNFHLKSMSPCIDTGVDVGLREDINGTKIPQGSVPDIGVYEYSLSAFLYSDDLCNGKIHAYNVALILRLHLMLFLQFSPVFEMGLCFLS